MFLLTQDWTRCLQPADDLKNKNNKNTIDFGHQQFQTIRTIYGASCVLAINGYHVICLGAKAPLRAVIETYQQKTSVFLFFESRFQLSYLLILLISRWCYGFRRSSLDQSMKDSTKNPPPPKMGVLVCSYWYQVWLVSSLIFVLHRN